MYSFMGGGLFCAWVGTILLVVATATDHWMQYRLSGSFAHQGLWRYCLGNKCYLQTESIAYWNATRAFMILSSLCATSGIIMGILAFAQQPTFTRLSRPFSAGIMFFASKGGLIPSASQPLVAALFLWLVLLGTRSYLLSSQLINKKAKRLGSNKDTPITREIPGIYRFRPRNQSPKPAPVKFFITQHSSVPSPPQPYSPAFFVLLALAIYTGVTVSFLGRRFGDWRFSWSYILGWVALLMAFFAGIFYMCAYRMHECRRLSAPR